MNSRELAICFDILGGNALDCATAEHIDYICEQCLVNQWHIMVGGQPAATYDFQNKTWKLDGRLSAAILGLGLMNEQEEFDEDQARKLHTNFDEQWGTPSKPSDVGWAFGEKK